MNTKIEPICGIHTDQAVMEMVTKGRSFANPGKGRVVFERGVIVLSHNGSRHNFAVEDFARRFSKIGWKRA